MSGLQNIPIRWPERYDPAFFDRLFREVLANADVRNANAGAGITITGTPDEVATIAASQDIEDLIAAGILTATDSGVDTARQLVAGNDSIVITDNGGGSTIEISVGEIQITQLGPIPDLTVLGVPTSDDGFDPITTINATANDTLLRRVADTLDFGVLTAGMFPDSMVTALGIDEFNISTDLFVLNDAGGTEALRVTDAGMLQITGGVGGSEFALAPGLEMGYSTIQGAGFFQAYDRGTAQYLPLSFTGSVVNAYTSTTGQLTHSFSSDAFASVVEGVDRHIRLTPAAGSQAQVFRSGSNVQFHVYDGGGTDSISLYHDGTNGYITGVNTTAFVFSGAAQLILNGLGSADARVYLRHNSNASSGFLFESAGDNIAYVWNYENAPIYFGTNNVLRFLVGTSQIDGYLPLTMHAANAVVLYNTGDTQFSSLSMSSSELQILNSYGNVLISPASGSVAYVYRAGATADFRVYDSAGSDYLRLFNDGSANRIYSNTGRIDIRAGGVAGIQITTDPRLEVISGMVLRVYDASNTDYVDQYHTGSHYVMAATNTGEILAFEANPLGGSIGTLSTGTHGITLNVSSTDNQVLYFGLYNPDGSANRRAALYLDEINDEWGLTQTYSSSGTPFYIRSGGTAGFVLHPSGGYVGVVGNYEFRVFDSGGTDYVRLGHNGTDFVFTAVNTANLTFQSYTGFAGFAGQVRANGGGMQVNSGVASTGVNEQMAFFDIAAGTGRFGSYNWGTSAWQPVGLYGSTVALYVSGSAILSISGTTVSIAGSLTATGDGTFNTSDRALKRAIERIDRPVDRMRAVRGYTYEKNVGGQWESERRAGVIAQDLEPVLPEAVIQRDGVRFVSDAALSGLFAEAINELIDRVEEIERRAA